MTPHSQKFIATVCEKESQLISLSILHICCPFLHKVLATLQYSSESQWLASSTPHTRQLPQPRTFCLFKTIYYSPALLRFPFSNELNRLKPPSHLALSDRCSSAFSTFHFSFLFRQSNPPSLTKDNLKSLERETHTTEYSERTAMEKQRIIRQTQRAGFELGFKLPAKVLQSSPFGLKEWVEDHSQ